MPKKTCQLVIESGNDYVIAAKDNQPKLHRHIQRIAAFHKPRSRYIETEKTKNRLTTRTVEVFDDLNGIHLCWAGIKSLIRVERTGTRGGQPYHEVVCYISSLIHPAREFACGIRGHWSIENRLHWIKDVVALQSSAFRRVQLKLNHGAQDLQDVYFLAIFEILTK